MTKFCLRCYSTRREEERVDRFGSLESIPYEIRRILSCNKNILSLSNDINREKICCCTRNAQHTRDIPFSFSPVRRLSNLQFHDNGVEVESRCS